MILLFYITSIVVSKYTNTPILGIAACLFPSLYLKTIIECMAAFSGVFCAFQIKDSPKFWKLILINAMWYMLFILLFRGSSTDVRILFTFVLAGATWVAKKVGLYY